MKLTSYRMHEFRAMVEGPDALERFRAELHAAGYGGWTEYPCSGYWQGGAASANAEVSLFTEDEHPHLSRIANALLEAHRDPSGVFQLIVIDPDGARRLIECRAAIPAEVS